MRRSVLLLLIGAISCGGESPRPGPPAASLERPYRPPADGKLTERQVQAFVAARRAKMPPSAAREMETEAEVESFDGRKGSDEYLWVRQRIFESEIRTDSREAEKREVGIDRKTAASLGRAAAASTDASTRASLSKQAADLERRAAELERTSQKRPSPEDAANDALVARYRRLIDAAELGAAGRRP